MRNQLNYQGHDYSINENETVLDCLLREDCQISHSCKSGTCQSCMMQAVAGDIPEKAQVGLKANYKKQNLFLSCQCVPTGDMKVCGPDEAGLDVRAFIARKEFLNHNVVKICLKHHDDFECEPGQYLTLVNPEGVARSYSIANDPKFEGVIELHVRLIEDGKMSDWLKDVAEVGSEVVVRGPAGSCFYVDDEGDKDYPIILAGTGTGLAPLYGIVNEALAREHRGAIQLFHGALNEKDLYLVEELRAVEAAYGNFSYTACVLEGEADQDYCVGDLQKMVIESLPSDKAAVNLFLCGAPSLVNPLKTKAFLSGLASQKIFTDPFLPSKN